MCVGLCDSVGERKGRPPESPPNCLVESSPHSTKQTKSWVIKPCSLDSNECMSHLTSGTTGSAIGGRVNPTFVKGQRQMHRTIMLALKKENGELANVERMTVEKGGIFHPWLCSSEGWEPECVGTEALHCTGGSALLLGNIRIPRSLCGLPGMKLPLSLFQRTSKRQDIFMSKCGGFVLSNLHKAAECQLLQLENSLQIRRTQKNFVSF